MRAADTRRAALLGLYACTVATAAALGALAGWVAAWTAARITGESR